MGGLVERPDFYLYLSARRNLEIVGALYGGHEGTWTTIIAVCCGMIAGGVIAVVMMLLRGDLHKNSQTHR